MSSPPTITQQLQRSSRSSRAARYLRSHWTFGALQLLDLLSTLAAFRAGAVEVNPLVAHFTVYFGRVGGVLMSKVIAVLIALGVRRLIWVVNIFYLCVIFWNVIVLIVLSLHVHSR
jgi:hypothetical protein